jgi:hypothetical protein
MSTRDDYNETEWKAISAAPVAAGLLITLSDASSPVGVAKEAMAVGRAISDSAASGTPEVVKALADSVKAGGRPALPDIPTGNRAQMKEALTGVINAAVSALQSKSPAEVGAYKTWLVSVAVKVAQATKEGGFLGIGGTLVSSDEQQALRQLADLLEVSVPQAAAQS